MQISCDGCQKTMLYVGWNVCMDCTRRRHKAVCNRGKCVCRTEKYGRTCKAYSRTWMSCNRCLGTIKQLS